MADDAQTTESHPFRGRSLFVAAAVTFITATITATATHDLFLVLTVLGACSLCFLYGEDSGRGR